MKLTGKRSAGNPHATFDEAEVGNVLITLSGAPVHYLLGGYCLGCFTGFQHYIYFYLFIPDGVRNRYCRRFGYFRVLHDRVFYLYGRDILSAAPDDILGTTYKEQISLTIKVSDIAGMDPPVPVNCRSFLRVVPVSQRHAWP